MICSCDTVAPLPNDTYTTESFGCLFSQSNSKQFLDELPDCVTIGPIGYTSLFNTLQNSLSSLKAVTVLGRSSSQQFFYLHILGKCPNTMSFLLWLFFFFFFFFNFIYFMSSTRYSVFIILKKR